MGKYKIAVIVGSLRRDSWNAKFAEALIKLFPADFEFNRVSIGELPLYNQDLDGKQPPAVQQFKQAITEASGLLFVTPEYNRSIPGVLKNALDHGSRPYGQNAFGKKPAGVIGASVGAMGTAMAQQHLRNILSYLDVPTFGQPEAFVHAKEGLFDANGNIGEASREFMQGWVNRFVAWVKQHAV